MYMTILETNDKKKGVIVLDDSISGISESLGEWLNQEEIKYDEVEDAIIVNKEKRVVGQIKIVEGNEGMASHKVVNYYGQR